MNIGTRLARLAHSTEARFLALLSIMQLALAAVLLTVLAQQVRGGVVEREKATAEQMVADLSLVAEAEGVRRLTTVLRDRPGDGTVVLLARRDGRRVAGGLPRWPSSVTTPTRWTETRLAGRPVGIVAAWLGPDARLMVARPLAAEADWSVLRRAMWLSLALGLPLAVFAAWIAMRLIDGRIDRVGRTVAAVTAGDLTRRVPRDGSGDRFDRLAGAVNRMLDRIDELLDQLRALSDGLAHDLRSPVTRLTARIERALGEGEAAADALPAVAAEAERLLTMLTSVLQISRADAGLGREQMAVVDVAGAVAELVAFYEPLVAERDRTLAATLSPAMARLHRPLFEQMLANLIDNALAHGAGPIRVALTAHAGWLRLSVGDTGPGIPPDRQADALRRFGRLDEARGGDGAGLGLSLVAAVAHLHDGGLTLEGGPGDFAVVVTLPAL